MKVNRADPGFGKLRRAARIASAHLPTDLPPVLVFTDPHRSSHPIELARAMPQGWALVYRHFGATDRLGVAESMSKLAIQRGFHLLIGNDPELASHVRASGVHWPERREPEAQRTAPQFALNTMSAHHPKSLVQPTAPDIQARVLSTVFPSESPSAGPAMGAMRFRQICQRATCPVYGLGGITAETALQISGFAGLAGVGRL